MARKTILFVRHGQAAHNPAAEQRRHEGGSDEEFLALMARDDCFDAPLTPLGVSQAVQGAAALAERWRGPPVDLVVASPLSRALATADLFFGGLPGPRLCLEGLREINGWLLNGRRRPRAELRALFPHWDFAALVAEDDVLWTEAVETEASCAERGYNALRWLWGRPEATIACVSHGGILGMTLARPGHPKIHTDPGMQRRFDTGEWRPCVLTAEADPRNPDAPVFYVRSVAQDGT